jgi:hypothetical protein
MALTPPAGPACGRSRVRRRFPAGRGLRQGSGRASLAGLLVLLGVAASAADPGGTVWGRLSVEAESPDGPLVPLAGVEVTLLPFTPALEAELERIRASARDGHRQYATAAGRVLGLLRGTPPGSASGTPRADAPASPASVPAGSGGDGRRTTDRWGVFLFTEVPAGQWLLAAVRTSALRTRDDQASRGPSRPRGDASRFTGRASTTSARWAEVWITPVRVDAGGDARVFLTDRGRWFAGPLP